MSATHNRLLGDWSCLKATLLVTAEKTFREPEALRPLVLVHDNIRGRPRCLALPSFQASSWRITELPVIYSGKPSHSSAE